MQETMKYGFLPGGDYQYYAPLQLVDLQGRKYRLEVDDARITDRISCVDFPIPRDTELEGATGRDFFTNYLRAMIKANNGVVDPASNRSIEINLTGISGRFKGAFFIRVYGLIEFEASVGNFKKTYCASMMDGDEGAPFGRYSFHTRKGAFRKIVSGAVRRALEEFMQDLAGGAGVDA